jgi:hypothetical protein
MARNQQFRIRRLRLPRFRRGMGGLVVRTRAAVADAGMATAEYAVGTLAAAGFAALLFAILRGGEMKTLLFGIIKRALSV